VLPFFIFLEIIIKSADNVKEKERTKEFLLKRYDKIFNLSFKKFYFMTAGYRFS